MIVTNILLYSRLNAVITVHQVVQDIALSWADTPFLLPIPRSDANLPKLMSNLGLIVIPSEDSLNQTDSDSSEGNSVTTYRLVSDLSILGDIYAKEANIVHDLTERNGTEPQSRRKDQNLSGLDHASESEERDDDLAPEQGYWKLDFTQIANVVLPATPDTILPPVSPQHLKIDILDKIANRDSLFETMYPPIKTLLTIGCLRSLLICFLFIPIR
jgi:hypothetical protein